MPLPTRETLRDDLAALGVRPGDIVLMHSSFKSIGIDDPETILGALTDALGPEGTLLLPALSYLQVPADLHDTRATPTCVGFLTEYFRKRPGTLRSLHPTHSVCGIGARRDEMLASHAEDRTPCGSHSPFRRNIEMGGKILMLGCGLRPNTTMHAVEELVGPPYVFGPTCCYTITDREGRVFRKEYVTHGFKGVAQRYDLAAALLTGGEIRRGLVGRADSYLMDAAALCRRAIDQLRKDPMSFVESFPPVPAE